MVGRSAQSPPAVLHIGMPKSASTSLQVHLFARHSQIAYLGLYNAHTRRGNEIIKERWLTRQMEQLHFDLAERRPLSANVADCRERFETQVLAKLEPKQVPVWSWESMMLNRAKVRVTRARNLKAVLGESRVVAVLRQPVKLIESVYFQYLKRVNVGKDSHWRGPTYKSLEQWLRWYWPGSQDEPPPHLDYAFTLRTFVDFFGKENVKVLLLEDLARDQDRFLGDLCRYMGVDAEEGIRLAKDKRENSRLTVEQIERIQALQATLWQRLRFRLQRTEQRRELLGIPAIGADEPSAGVAAKAPLPAEWKERVCDATRQGHRWLAETFGLPLAEYGYPM